MPTIAPVVAGGSSSLAMLVKGWIVMFKIGERTLADAVLDGDSQAIELVARNVLRIKPDNLVERPWGGNRLVELKGIGGSVGERDLPWGESFELCCFQGDPEARVHPSIVKLADGSEMGLPHLLGKAGVPILGEDFVAANGCEIPLLPKLLDVKQLLSVQVHPPGHPEVYVILDADEGATIRLGFCRSVSRRQLASLVFEGRRAQEELLLVLGDKGSCARNQDRLHEVLSSLVATCKSGPVDSLDAVTSIATELATELGLASPSIPSLARLFDFLRRRYWQVLDLLNEVPVVAGQVIANVTQQSPSPSPSSWSESSRVPLSANLDAEVHALGNPEGKEILMLEIRRPGPTYRVWDNARFPLRRLDIELALESMSVEPRERASFYASGRKLEIAGGRLCRFVENSLFVVDRLDLARGEMAMLPSVGWPRTIHVIAGQLEICSGSRDSSDSPITLTYGQSALVPAALDEFSAACLSETAAAVLVSIPAVGR
ncbi:MAG: hypothetical protein V2A73_22795 [Pseudomonadota bacterium]